MTQKELVAACIANNERLLEWAKTANRLSLTVSSTDLFKRLAEMQLACLLTSNLILKILTAEEPGAEE